MAYSVQQRTQEIGIRLALGAETEAVRNMIIRQGMGVALIGVGIGLASAFGLARVIAGFLFGVTTRDPLAFIAVPVLLTAVALIGVWLPARRAAQRRTGGRTAHGLVSRFEMRGTDQVGRLSSGRALDTAQ